MKNNFAFLFMGILLAALCLAYSGAMAEEITILSQPSPASAAVGETVAFRVTADGATEYQWYYRALSGEDWTAVKNQGASDTYTLTVKDRHNGYQYRCRLSNQAECVYSETVSLTVIYKPVITEQPKSVKANTGSMAVFQVKASGAASYQWYFRASSEESWKPVEKNGAADTYHIAAKTRLSGYQYRCVLSNAAGTIYSNPVTLTVTVPVTSVVLNKTNVSIAQNDTETLLARVQPSQATNRAVSWTSSNPKVASVENGVITALRIGTAVITVKTADGGKEAVCVVKVKEISSFQYDNRCLVCLGYRLNADGSMTGELIGRLQATLRAAQKYPNSIIVCTGGHTASENAAASEAGQMAKWLKKNGVDPERILVEDASLTTAQNADFTFELLFGKYPQTKRLVIITSDYHMDTAVRIFRNWLSKAGSAVTVTAGEAYPAP